MEAASEAAATTPVSDRMAKNADSQALRADNDIDAASFRTSVSEALLPSIGPTVTGVLSVCTLPETKEEKFQETSLGVEERQPARKAVKEFVV